VSAHLRIADCLKLGADPAGDAAIKRVMKGELREGNATRKPNVAMCDIALLPRSAQSDFSHQAVTVLHTQRLLEYTTHLLPVSRRGSGCRREGKFCTATIKNHVKPVDYHYIIWRAPQTYCRTRRQCL
jgi:hypothetical protein